MTYQKKNNYKNTLYIFKIHQLTIKQCHNSEKKSWITPVVRTVCKDMIQKSDVSDFFPSLKLIIKFAYLFVYQYTYHNLY